MVSLLSLSYLPPSCLSLTVSLLSLYYRLSSSTSLLLSLFFYLSLTVSLLPSFSYSPLSYRLSYCLSTTVSLLPSLYKHTHIHTYTRTPIHTHTHTHTHTYTHTPIHTTEFHAMMQEASEVKCITIIDIFILHIHTKNAYYSDTYRCLRQMVRSLI
jgi:hypothetical protein